MCQAHTHFLTHLHVPLTWLNVSCVPPHTSLFSWLNLPLRFCFLFSLHQFFLILHLSRPHVLLPRPFLGYSSFPPLLLQLCFLLLLSRLFSWLKLPLRLSFLFSLHQILFWFQWTSNLNSSNSRLTRVKVTSPLTLKLDIQLTLRLSHIFIPVLRLVCITTLKVT